MSEPREIELKLECEPSDFATLQGHPLLQEAAAQDTAQLTSVYFDTPDQQLREAGFGLRVRKNGASHIQTIKAEGDGLFERPEWEQEVDGPEPDWDAIAKTPLGEVVNKKTKLKPFFITFVERRTYLVQQGSSRIEVALDSGRIETPATGGEVIPVCEIEL